MPTAFSLAPLFQFIYLFTYLLTIDLPACAMRLVSLSNKSLQAGLCPDSLNILCTWIFDSKLLIWIPESTFSFRCTALFWTFSLNIDLSLCTRPLPQPFARSCCSHVSHSLWPCGPESSCKPVLVPALLSWAVVTPQVFFGYSLSVLIRLFVLTFLPVVWKAKTIESISWSPAFLPSLWEAVSH